MDEKRVSAAELKRLLAEDLDCLAEKIAEAMNAARDGRIIADTEELVRDAHAEFRERAYQKAIGLLQEKQEASSPSGQGLRNKGPQETTHLTVNGRLRLRRTVYWSKQTGTVVPADRWLGILRHRFSPGVREMCCREALHCSFPAASDNLRRTAQMSLSDRSVREIAERQGRAVLEAQQSGALRAGFTAADCTDQTMITGADGVMVPLVTEEQKRKRRARESAKRDEQDRSSTARVGRPRQGSDGPYKEFKVLLFYDPDKSHCHVVGTSGDHEALGGLMRREGARLDLGQAKVKYAVTDGAEWIANEYRRQLPMLDEHILDYYHLREHVVQASQVLYGEGTKKAEEWRDDVMGWVWEQGSLVMLHRLGPYLGRHRGGPKHEALVSLRDYVSNRVAMTDYPAFRQLGYDCGSGPTEAQCGMLTDRLKGPGMRWDKDNAESMMALASVYHSGLWDTYWDSERAAV
jgi:hypothetical protein